MEIVFVTYKQYYSIIHILFYYIVYDVLLDLVLVEVIAALLITIKFIFDHYIKS